MQTDNGMSDGSNRNSNYDYGSEGYRMNVME